jgi:hypothetical protein
MLPASRTAAIMPSAIRSPSGYLAKLPSVTIASKRCPACSYNSSATTPPRLHPTNVKRSICSPSSTVVTSCANPARVMRDGSGSGLHAPLPRSSTATHPTSFPNASSCRSQIAAVEPTPCTKTSVVEVERAACAAATRAPVFAPSGAVKCRLSIMRPFVFERRTHERLPTVAR